MENQSFDIAIVGGGIVGLATAWTLKQDFKHLKIVILEKNSDVAEEQTGHNSGVIHSGIYYKPGSAKAKNCLRGYGMLLEFLAERKIKHDICGKVIVATQENELPILDRIFQRGVENGLKGLEKIGPDRLKEIEPHCQGLEAIWVPQAGIVNYKTVSDQLKKEVEQMGVSVRCMSKVAKITQHSNRFKISAEQEIDAGFVVTTSGLYSDRVAKMLKPDLDFRVVPFRGEYYQLADTSQHLVNNLIYPVPNPEFPFLGVHFTRMIDGGVEAGPNAVLAMSRQGYSWRNWNLRDLFESLTWPGFLRIAMKHWPMGMGEVYRSLNKSAFTRALRKLIPELENKDLVPCKAGVRAQACDRKGLIDDFWIEEGENFLLVLNAPSPAATSCLSIGRTIVDQLAVKLDLKEKVL